MRGDEFEKITTQIQQTTNSVAEEWRRLAVTGLSNDDIRCARSHLRSVGFRVDRLADQIMSTHDGPTSSNCGLGRMNRLTSELIENRLSVQVLQQAYSVLQEASELEERLRRLRLPHSPHPGGTVDGPQQEHLTQVWPLAVGLQAQLEELGVRASHACVPQHFFVWAEDARHRLALFTTRIVQLRDGAQGSLVGS